MKKLLCFLMSLAMLLSVMPANVVWAEEMGSEEVESIIARVEATPIEIIEGTGGCIMAASSEDGAYSYYWHYDPYSIDWDMQMTVYYKDGQSFSGDRGQIFEQTGFWADYSFVSQDIDHVLTPGTYTGEVSVDGVTAQFPVTIVESPVESIEITAFDIPEGTNMANGWRWEVDHQIEYWYYNGHPDQITIYYKDGNVFSGDLEEVYNQTGYWVDYRFEVDQEENPAPVGSYTAYASFMGAEAYYQVNIIDNPMQIVGMELAPSTYEYGTVGYLTYMYDPDGTMRYYWNYNLDDQLQITIFFKDGSTFAGTIYEIFEQIGEHGYVALNYDVDWEHPLTVGEYPVTASLGSFRATSTVTLTESSNPVVSVTAAPVVIPERTSGGIAYEINPDGTQYTYWNYNVESPEITVTYSDGQSITGTRREIWEATGMQVYYAEPNGSQSWENQLDLGTYEAAVGFMGVISTYSVSIVENPDLITKFEVAPIEIMEGTCGSLTYDRDETGNILYYWAYDYWNAWDHQITVHYQDGRVISGTRQQIGEQTDTWATFNYLGGQSASNPLGVGTYEMTAELGGLTSTYEATIVKSPVESIEVAPLEIIEGTRGYTTMTWDGDGQLKEYWTYNVTPEQVTVHYTDGRSVSGSPEDIYFMTGYNVSSILYQNWDRILVSGSYQACAMFMGVMTNYTVTIKENPRMITAIDIAPIEVMEGESGYLRSEMDFDGVNHYFWLYQVDSETEMTVYFKDGTSISGKAYEISTELSVWPDIRLTAPQNAANPLSPGTYYTSVTINGVTGTGSYTIVKSTVQSISFDEPIRMIEKADGYWMNDYNTGESYFHYDNRMPEYVTIQYEDGTERRLLTRELYSLTGGSCTAIDSQSSANPFQLGENEVSVYYKGVYGSYTVTVEETPVERIEYEPVIVVEGNQEGNRIRPLHADVYFKDGTVITGKTLTEITKETGYSFGNVICPDLVYGANTATINFMGKTAEFTIQYVETPVERIEMDPWVVPEEEMSVLWANIDRLSGTIYLKDGTVYKGKLSDFCALYGESSYFGIYSAFDGNFVHMSSSTEHAAEFSLMGHNVTVPLVVEPDIVSYEVDDITIVGGGDFPVGRVLDLRGTVHYSNGETYTGLLRYADTKGSIYVNGGWDTNVLGDQTVEVFTYGTGCTHTVTCTVHVIENPIETIVFDECYDSDQVACWGTIHYKDGTTERFDFSKWSFTYMGCEYPIMGGYKTENGNKVFDRILFGQVYRCSLIPYEPQYRSASMDVSEEGDIILTLERMDGSLETVEVLGYDKANGRLLTDKGYIENVTIKYAIWEKYDKQALIFLEEEITCEFPENEAVNVMFLLPVIYDNALWRNFAVDMPECIDGKPTAENIDYLVSFAVTANYLRTFREMPGVAYVQCTVDEAIQYVKATWGIELNDLSDCHLVHPITGLVNCPVEVGARGMDPSVYATIYEDRGMLKHISENESYISVLVASDGHIIGMRKGMAIGEVIATLADGQEWYLVNGRIQQDFTGSVTIDGVDYEIVEGVVQKNESIDPTIQGSSLTLNGDIGLNFYLNLDAALVNEGAYAVFEQNGIVSEPVMLANVIHSGKQYKLIYHVSAKEMDDTIVLKLFDGEGNPVTLYKGDEEFTTGYSYSVNTYIELALSSNEVSDKLKDLMRSMRQYGSSAQNYFGYGNGNNVDSIMVDASVFAPYEYTYQGTGYGVVHQGSSLLLKDLTTVRHYFTVSGDMTDYLATVNGKETQIVQKGQMCYVEVSDIAAQNLDDMALVIISDQNGNEKYRLVYGAFSYADTAMYQSNNDQLKTLMAALYLYWQSAEAYFTK